MRVPLVGVVAVAVACAVLAAACGDDAPRSPNGGLSRVASRLTDAPARSVRRIAALLFDIGRGPPDGARVLRAFDTAPNSVRALYRAVSYGMQDLAVDVLGPYRLPLPLCLTKACCGPGSDQSGNGPAVAQIIAGLPEIYDHYFWIYGDSLDDPACSTWADLGTPAAPARYASFARVDVTAVAQEIGHNLGMEHEHSLDCGGIESWADDPSGCTTVEYGSNLSFMGIGTGHPSGFNKAHEGWLSGCNIVATDGAGRFTLSPLGLPCGGPQLLQIPAPKVRHPPRQDVAFYYAELRTSFGQDTARVPTVLLYAGPDFSAPEDYAAHTFLLAPRLMAAGQSFDDPGGGLTITLETISSSSATLVITGPPVGTATCADGTPLTAPDAIDGGDGSDGSRCTAGVGGAGGARAGGIRVEGGSGGAAWGPGSLDDGGAGERDPAGATPLTDAGAASGCVCSFPAGRLPDPFGGETALFLAAGALGLWRFRRHTRTGTRTRT